MKLSVLERILLLGLLPKEGNILTVRLIRTLREKIEFKEEEIKLFEIKTVSSTTGDALITWNKKAETEVEIDITTLEKTIIVEQLKDVNDKKKLTPDHISLYEKFLEQ